MCYLSAQFLRQAMKKCGKQKIQILVKVLLQMQDEESLRQDWGWLQDRGSSVQKREGGCTNDLTVAMTTSPRHMQTQGRSGPKMEMGMKFLPEPGMELQVIDMVDEGR